ncbi:MAG: GNAT family N-acetyltransferase [Metallosphaera sp.]
MRSNELVNLFLDSKKGYFRYLAFIEGPIEYSLEVLREYLKVNNNPSTGYFFHPWIEGSKQRLKGFLNYLPQIVDIDYSSSQKYLGSTFDLVIIDAMDDFRPSYIARAIETVRGGGLALIYSDNIDKGKLYKSTITRDGKVSNLFENMFREEIKKHRGVIYYHNDIYVKPFSSQEVSRPRRSRSGKHPEVAKLCVTDDQVKVLDEIDFILEEGKRLFIVTAPRGRGKSASVGLSLPVIISLSKYPLSIVVTSLNYWSGAEIMKFAEMALRAMKKRFRRNVSRDGKILSLEIGESWIRWLPPDLAKDYHGNIIVMDEAAALGKEFIDYVLRRWEKAVLVTTVHGYEGSGKIFLKVLEAYEKERNAQRLNLEFPIRYSKGDPVEKFLYDVFLLNVNVESGDFQGRIIEVTPESLFNVREKLMRVYGILVTAHYRNTPDDLMVLGDATFQRIFLAENDVGVAQVVEEGGLSDEKVDSLSAGEENLGHLIPQRLVKYSRLREFGKLRGWRVMRIAVVPDLQNRGIGSRILSEIEKEAIREGIDWIGSSFLANYNVVKFWTKNGFIPVYMSTKKNESLGGYSVIVAKALSPEATGLIRNASIFFKDKLLRTLHQVYFNVDPLVITRLLKSTPSIDERFTIPDLYIRKINSYLDGTLPYNPVAEAVHMLGEKYFKELKFTVDDALLAGLVSRTFQGKSWYHAGVSLGKKSAEVEETLRQAIRSILNKYQLN